MSFEFFLTIASVFFSFDEQVDVSSWIDQHSKEKNFDDCKLGDAEETGKGSTVGGFFSLMITNLLIDVGDVFPNGSLSGGCVIGRQSDKSAIFGTSLPIAVASGTQAGTGQNRFMDESISEEEEEVISLSIY